MSSARFSVDNFLPYPNGRMSPFDANFRDLRYAIPSDREILVTAKEQADLPNLALQYLGDNRLWWVILQYNGLYDPIEDIQPGVKLRIPRRAALIAYLEGNNARISTQTTLRI
jgi:hypothetical protein